MINNRGSQWRKWDLHIHTPFSIEHHYGTDNDETWEKYITDLENLPEEFSVIGINDYIFLDGYKKVIEYKKSGRLKNIDTILPIIELRIDKFGNIEDKAWKKVNLHIIFSDEIDADIIESQFLNAIQVNYKLTPMDDESLSNIEFTGVITKKSLSDLGQQIKKSSSIDINGSDLKVGFSNFTHSYDKVKEALQSHYFKDKYLKAVGKTEWDAMRWTGSIADKKTIINEADFVFISTEDAISHDRARTQLKSQNVTNYLLDCSDSHAYSDSSNKDRIGNSLTWIKADTTFKGLQQAKMEFDERVYIGDLPEILTRVKHNRTKYIKSLNIKQIDGYTNTKGKWFDDIDIEFNNELVSIIGNKGSGKSALSDICALLGNSHNEKHFSFLSGKKFRKGKLAENFIATLLFESGETLTKKLDENVDTSEVERVRYLPQNYFEELCNDLEGEGFENALKNVVYSHLDDEEKLDTNDFNELISLKINSIEKDIDIITPKIEVINKEIIELESKQQKSYRNSIESKLKLKFEELINHITNKPKKVEIPSEERKEDQSYQELLSNINKSKDTLKVKETELKDKKIEKQLRLLSVSDLTTLKNDLLRIDKQIQEFKDEKHEIFEKYHLKIDEVLKISIDIIKIDTLIEINNKSIVDINSIILNNDKESGLEVDISKLKISIENMEKELSKPDQEYRQYLEDLLEWKDIRNKIIGLSGEHETIKFFQQQLKYLTTSLVDDIKEKRDLRIGLSLQIYDKKFEVVSIFKQLKVTIDRAIGRYSELLVNYDIAIDATFKLEDFEKNFLIHIQQNRMGSFYGADEGKMKLREIIEEKNLDDRDIFKEILEDLISYLEKDYREDSRYTNQEREITEQVKNVYDLYDYVYNLKYLMPNYELKLDNKGLSELSPGEKGALLLVFFLMLDKEDIPLIIDQPEDNLDNQSVYKIVVQFIKHAKKRRQIIMVTHNPNLAVVADAEQIIHANINKQADNEFAVKTGAIENPEINQCILDILEGTRPAFETRRNKYF